MEKTKMTFGARVKEACRKFIVSLKRKPTMIPLVMLVITFLFFSLNLTTFSNTTARIQGTNMGLWQFVIMLLSMLSMLCFMNAFPRRKPVNIPMLVLMFVMFAVIIFADISYRQAIIDSITTTTVLSTGEEVLSVSSETSYIAYAYYYLFDHMVMLIISIVLVILLPVYSKLIRKIKTSIDVEENKNMGTIDIAGDD